MADYNSLKRRSILNVYRSRILSEISEKPLELEKTVVNKKKINKIIRFVIILYLCTPKFRQNFVEMNKSKNI
jgi:hypothetical protein